LKWSDQTTYGWR